MAGASKVAGIYSAATTLFLPTLLLAGTVGSQQIPNLNATAINWPWSSAWEGNDGLWGTFFIHVGTPSQIVRVLPAINWQETWVVDSAACDTSAAETCNDPRGGTFTANASGTWNDYGFFKTDLSKDLGKNAIGDYGLERLGITNVDSGPTYSNQVVVSVNSPQWYQGLFGMGNQPTNFSDFNNPQPSFLTSLYNAGKIPSLSWGYQAGAQYRGKTSSASVIFGGYDDSRYVDNDIVFTQSNDFTYPFLVALSSLKVSGIYNAGQVGTAELLDGDWLRDTANQLVSIDSTTSYLWLSNATCSVFEAALNLTYNAATQLYLLTDDQHNQLLDLNPTFTFTISDSAQNDTTLEITLPYNAFSLEASGPELLGNNTKSWYFPLKRLPDGGNARLGRVFLQEVYIFAEYHFGKFRVYQADWSGRPQNIVTHLPTQVVSTPKKSSTPVGAIAGGVVGGVAVIAAIAGGYFFWRRRKQQQTKLPPYDPNNDPNINNNNVPEIDGAVKLPPEIGGGAAGGGASAWENKSAWQANNANQGVVAVDGVHEIHGHTAEKQWNEADGTPITRPYGEKYTHQGSGSQQGQFYAELSSGDVIGPAVQELPSGETIKKDK
ncbi:hypothetical protein H072_2342 [Dactylellina haptotyla CBS 200.50]|uniref:Peptidase A1 domain-containing protein n=1 Tax=Dactylellina haptotyla (strain CBS 200.50) TaxID=1284197 RepID=S8BVS1_DACHA|nr:hypothetical protein H072_2342 [Dactylellina haptotyla CBS 200.50]